MVFTHSDYVIQYSCMVFFK